MALADLSAYKALLANPHQRIPYTKNPATTIAGKLHSLFLTVPFAGVAPTTAAVPTNSRANGYIGQQNAASPKLRLGKNIFSCGDVGTLLLCDRLSHQGGLSGIVNTAQTTNLPTAALTRYTDGVGVWAALEIYTAIGATGTTFTVSYTNQAGTSGQTSDAQNIGTATYNTAGRLLIAPLAAGDYGVRAVASVTLAASTGTAGNFGVTLFKPLCAYPIFQKGQQIDYGPLDTFGGYMPEILDDACLFFAFLPASTSTGVIMGDLSFFED